MNTVELSINEIIGVLGFIVTLLGIGGTVIWNMWRKMMENTAALHQFKIEVAEKYASYSQIMEMESRLIRTEERLLSSIEQLTTRIDRILTRIDNN